MFRGIVFAPFRVLSGPYTEVPFWRQITAILLAWAVVGPSSPGALASVPAQVRTTPGARAIASLPKKGLPNELRGLIPDSSSSSQRPAPIQVAALSHVVPKLHADIPAPSSTSSISSNFNGTAIPGGDYIWFNSAFKVSGVSSSGTTIYIQGQTIQFSSGSTPYTVSVPNSKVVLSPQTTTATTTFDAVQNLWVTNLPLSFSGNGFLSGVGFPVPASGLPGGITPVSWTATFWTTTPGVSINWQWAAAVYSQFSTVPNQLGVKPFDQTSGSNYANSDHAGTPENYKSYVLGGATGGGASNYTGSYSGTASVTPQQYTEPPPVANAGAAQSVYVGTAVTLDGSGSYDQEGDSITYQWSLSSVPAGSAATLTNSTRVNPTFSVDKAGSYTAQLIVYDGHTYSAPATVIISTLNSAPVANAGPAQTVVDGTLVQLDGGKSSDVDGDQLTYSWVFTGLPAGSSATLSNANSVNPTFTPDLTGDYAVQLVVNDGKVNSQPSQVTITTTNSPPVAIAGANQSVNVNTKVQLDGSKSYDVDRDQLTYHWSLSSVPSGSQATLSNANIVNPTFVADYLGTYVAQLIVNDGTSNGQPSTVTISTADVAPIANPGQPQLRGFWFSSSA